MINFIVLLILVSHTFALSIHEGIKGNAGEAHFQFLEKNFSAQTMARSGAGVAKNQEADPFINPALMEDTLQQVSVFIHHSEWDDHEYGLNIDTHFWNIPMGLFFRQTLNQFESKDNYNRSLGHIDTKSTIVGFRIASVKDTNLKDPRFGLSIKWIQDQLTQDAQTQGYALDLGIKMPAQNAGWQSGFSILDLGQRFSCSQTCSGQDWNNTRFIWGNQLRFNQLRKVIWNSDLDWGFFSPLMYRFSADWNVHPNLTLRAGKALSVAAIREFIQEDIFDSNTPSAPADPTWITLGFGIHYKQFKLNYGVEVGQGAVGLIHQTDLAWMF